MGRGVDRGKLAAWRRRLARREASGLTVAAFCRRERVSISLWKYWQRQVEREAAVACGTPRLRPAMPFAAVEIIPRRSVFLRFPGGASKRFDGVFFVDLPGRDQKDAIWGIYTRHYGLDAKQARPDDTNWTDTAVDLARWRHWESVAEVATLWDRLGRDDPLVRRAVAGYLTACPLESARHHAAAIAAANPDAWAAAVAATGLPPRAAD